MFFVKIKLSGIEGYLAAWHPPTFAVVADKSDAAFFFTKEEAAEAIALAGIGVFGTIEN